MEERVTLPINAEDYDAAKSWHLASWCHKQGAEDWTLKIMSIRDAKSPLIEHFDEVTKHWRLPEAKREQMTAYGDVSTPDAFIQPTERRWLNSASFAFLQECLPDGLFTHPAYEADWFEDPVFYRKGELILGIVSHENTGILRVTKNECRLLEAEGFTFSILGIECRVLRPFRTMP